MKHVPKIFWQQPSANASNMECAQPYTDQIQTVAVELIYPRSSNDHTGRVSCLNDVEGKEQSFAQRLRGIGQQVHGIVSRRPSSAEFTALSLLSGGYLNMMMYTRCFGLVQITFPSPPIGSSKSKSPRFVAIAPITILNQTLLSESSIKPFNCLFGRFEDEVKVAGSTDILPWSRISYTRSDQGSHVMPRIGTCPWSDLGNNRVRI